MYWFILCGFVLLSIRVFLSVLFWKNSCHHLKWNNLSKNVSAKQQRISIWNALFGYALYNHNMYFSFLSYSILHYVIFCNYFRMNCAPKISMINTNWSNRNRLLLIRSFHLMRTSNSLIEINIIRRFACVYTKTVFFLNFIVENYKQKLFARFSIKF